MSKNSVTSTKLMLFAGILAGSVIMLAAFSQAAQGKKAPGANRPPATSPAATYLMVERTGTRLEVLTEEKAGAPTIASAVTSARQAMMYLRVWGIDDLHIRSTASGSLIRFSYRVVDADKAKLLNDKKTTPYLLDEKAGLALQIPVMEKVGQLRQVATPQNGREYWMAFSNKGHHVSPGNHVDVVIGRVRIEGLVVEGIQPFKAPSR